MDLLNGHYQNDWLNVGEEDFALDCPAGYHFENGSCVIDSGLPPDNNGGGEIFITNPLNECTHLSGTPCDKAFEIDPNPPVCTSYNGAMGDYLNAAGEAALVVGAIAGAINGIGAAVGQIFGMKTAQITAQQNVILAEQELEMEKQKRQTAVNIILGVVALGAIGVGIYTTVKYVNRK